MFISFWVTISCQKLILDKNHAYCAAIAAAFSEIQKSGLSYDKPLNLHGAEGRTRTGTSVNPLDFEIFNGTISVFLIFFGFRLTHIVRMVNLCCV